MRGFMESQRPSWNRCTHLRLRFTLRLQSQQARRRIGSASTIKNELASKTMEGQGRLVNLRMFLEFEEKDLETLGGQW